MSDTEDVRAGASSVLNTEDFALTLKAWKDEFCPLFQPGESWAIVGIKRRGAVLAKRIWDECRVRVPDLAFGEVDISLYRDDYHLQNSQPRVLGTKIEFTVDGCSIVLIDDVLFTGRTVRAAIDLILDFGRPRKILLAALVDRGHRELPIAADFTGMTLATLREDHVQVRLTEMNGQDEVLLGRGGLAEGA